MKKIIVILFLLVGVIHSAIAQSVVSSELNGFIQAIENVHYLAKIKVTKVEVTVQDDGLEKQVYFADVLDTYKGESHKNITYEMLVEQGEDVVFNSTPVYVALCIDSTGNYYWPGTGSEFKLSTAIDLWLAENKEKLINMDTVEGWCK
ncbi:hypothetical protein [Shewanella litoralis]|uniref:Uncharacterized protein n=1 Tax=Shewanella litoralis TaxID=2282700 RepID=A0ABQ2RCB9_9GAMM|nr:hypothetical protein [Shewanella litoralis]GGQ19482.1 hypothetical protein GCM10009411_19660 [Shewanella litoralis]